MKYLFKRDTFGATIAILLAMGILLYNPLNAHIFNPLKIALTDFAFSDLAFSESHLKNIHDDRIVVVNIDTAGRKTIASLLQRLRAYQPQVVGLDIFFPEKINDGNTELASEIKNFPNLIVAAKLVYDSSKKDFISSADQFENDDTLSGFVNFIGEEGGSVRFFSPLIQTKTSQYQSFAASVAKGFDTLAYQKLISRKNRVEYINYQRTDADYYIININDVLNNKIDSSFIRGKMVLVGFVSSDENNIEDKHFTPLNKKVLGRSIPDMNGVIIHANILSMILDGTYINKIPTWIIILFTIIITWLHVAFLIKYYIHKHKWFHLVVKLAELIISIVLFYISILLLRHLNIEIDFTLPLIAIIITVDILYFYEAFANWLEQRHHISSVFTKTHEHL